MINIAVNIVFTQMKIYMEIYRCFSIVVKAPIYSRRSSFSFIAWGKTKFKMRDQLLANIQRRRQAVFR